MPDRAHLSERGQPEKKGGGGDQKKVFSGNEMDVQGGDYDFLFKVNCAHNTRGENIEDYVHIRAKKALRYYLLKVVNILMLVFPALVLHIPTFIGGACGRVRGGQVFTHSTIYTGDRIFPENHHFMKKE